jgi:hypothetical protein
VSPAVAVRRVSKGRISCACEDRAVQ